ncbi:MAG: sigma-54-dependent Fis family transcriptional regulator [Planctomycetes bacterium]|nr:sigma-54-dependent Fis family transcriptional regulator [Planctomycetota bacterium]
MQLTKTVAITKDATTQNLLRKFSKQLFLADNLSEAIDICKSVTPELVIFDSQFDNSRIEAFFNSSNHESFNAPVAVITKAETQHSQHENFIEMGAIGCIKGPHDYLEMEKITSRLKNNHKKPESETIDFFACEHAAEASMVGKSTSTINALKMIKMVAQSQCNPVLVVGETGTGKEIAAKAIHNIKHPNEKFVAINCAALTANLLESELFGHVKGSFTGADKEKIGLLELAGNGTVFMDEISEMPLELQAKILRVLQEKTFRKVGGITDLKCNATIIASSNRNLYKETKEKRFRSDLYYRLNICPIKLAPLRSLNRNEDIEMLAKYFVQTSTICPDKKGKIKSITKMAIEALSKHHWPGNIRELKNVIDRAILLETTEKIGMSSIIIDSEEMQESNEQIAPNADNVINFSLSKAEKELIAKALRQTSGQKTRAASLLGITRATLYAKLKQYNIEKDSYSNNRSEELCDQPVTV